MTKEQIELYVKEWGDKEEFYLDPLELLNKPRRLFMGLEIRLAKQTLKLLNCYQDDDYYEDVVLREFNLVRNIIRQMKEDYYDKRTKNNETHRVEK